MLTLKIALRNIFRNTRRSVTTMATIAIGTIAILVFGSYVTYIELVVETSSVQRTGHLQIFRDGYFTYGVGAPAAWGIPDYQKVVDLVRDDPVLKPLTELVTPFQAMAGIAGNFKAASSKTFFGVGFIPADRDHMNLWDNYGTGSLALKRSGMTNDDLGKGIAGVGLVRILGLCEEVGLDNCPPHRDPPGKIATAPDQSQTLPSGISDLAAAELPTASGPELPTIDLLAATSGGAPNVVSLQIAHVEQQAFKEMDDNYVGLNLSLAQKLVYGRGEHQATGIVVQLHRTQDLEVARARLKTLITEHKLDLELRDLSELTPQYPQIISMFDSIFSFISVIIATVVLFTVSNAMGMSVIERTNEIGTIRALGLRRAGIRQQFLVEGGLLGIFGATTGLILSYAVVYAVNHAGLTWFPPNAGGVVPLRLYVLGFGPLSVGTWVGLIAASALAALVPAYRAARMAIVDALRHV